MKIAIPPTIFKYPRPPLPCQNALCFPNSFFGSAQALLPCVVPNTGMLGGSIASPCVVPFSATISNLIYTMASTCKPVPEMPSISSRALTYVLHVYGTYSLNICRYLIFHLPETINSLLGSPSKPGPLWYLPSQ